jgi:hypothetical protein
MDTKVEIYTPEDFTPSSLNRPWSVGHKAAPTAVITHAIRTQWDGLGAFNLLPFRPENLHLMCTQVDHEVVFCFLRGNFG